MKHLFIVNPVAGGRKGGIDEVRQELAAFAETLSDPFEIYITKAPMDASGKIAEEADKGGELNVYACGGDGTLSECVNGAASKANVAVTHFPCGTGNDFVKTYSTVDTDMFRNLKALSEGTVKPIDAIRCVGTAMDKSVKTRIGINICSVGIDARIGTDVHKYSSIPVIGGATGYVISLVVNVVKGVVQKLLIKTSGETDSSGEPCEDRVFDGKYTLACVCNGRYYGGGFNPVPGALPDDGILDCLVVEPISRLKVAQIVGRYAKGRFAEFPDVFNHIRCTKMEIEAEREFIVNIDGEGIYVRKISFEVMPKSVRFIFPQGV